MVPMSQTQKLLLIIGLFWFAQYVYMPNTAPFLLAQKVSADFVGIIVGIYGGMQMLTRFPMGLMADILGRHKLIVIIGCFLSGSASIVRLVSPDALGFFFANMMSGLASAMWLSFMLLFTKHIPVSKMQMSLGYVFVANNSGIMIAFCVSAFLYAHFGMELMCICSIVSGGLALILALTLFEDDPAYVNAEAKAAETKEEEKEESTAREAKTAAAKSQPQAPHQYQQARERMGRPRLRELLKVVLIGRIWFFAFLAVVQQGVAIATILSFSNEVAVRNGATPLEMGFMTIVYTLFCVVSSYLSGLPILSRIGNGIVTTTAFVLLTVYCLGTVFLTNIYAMIAIQVLLGLSFGFIFCVANSEALQGVEGYRRSSALGLFQAIFAFGMLIIPIIAGVLIRYTETLDSAFYFQALVSLLSAVICAVYYGGRRLRKLNSCTAA